MLGVYVEPRAGDPTAAVRHACLHVRGHLVRTRHSPLGAGWPRFGTFIPDVEELSGDAFFCLSLRGQTIGGEPYLIGLVLAPGPEEHETMSPCCDKCSGTDLYVRVGLFEMESGDPLKYLGMRKPQDWADWGDEGDHVWFDRDAPMSEFVIL